MGNKTKVSQRMIKMFHVRFVCMFGCYYTATLGNPAGAVLYCWHKYIASDLYVLRESLQFVYNSSSTSYNGNHDLNNDSGFILQIYNECAFKLVANQVMMDKIEKNDQVCIIYNLSLVPICVNSSECL